MPVSEKPKVQVSDKIYEQCAPNSDDMPVLVTTSITYENVDVTGDGIKDKIAKYTESRWSCPKRFEENAGRVEIVQYGRPSADSIGVVKTKGGALTLNDTVLIGDMRHYVFAIPYQAFDKVPTPDDIRIVLIPEKTLDKIRTIQTSERAQKLKEQLDELQKKDPKTVDKKEFEKVAGQLGEVAAEIRNLIMSTVIAKRAKDLKKIEGIPLKKEDKDAVLNILTALRTDNQTALGMIQRAFTILAKEEGKAAEAQ